MKKYYIIHGWDGSPEEPLHRWLKRELEQRGHKVVVPEMPETETPHIESWVQKAEQIIEPNEDAVLIGHSIGCQTILRYISSLEEGKEVGDVILLAPWTNLKMDVIEEEGEESVSIAREWIDSPIDFEKAKKHVRGDVVAIFSNDDPVVPLSESQVFSKNMNAEVVVEKGKGHFTEEDGVTELSSLLKAAV